MINAPLRNVLALERARRRVYAAPASPTGTVSRAEWLRRLVDSGGLDSCGRLRNDVVDPEGVVHRARWDRAAWEAGRRA